MTKMEKFATVVALLEIVMIGYFEYAACKVITKKANFYFEKEAKRVAACQRQKFYENATDSDSKET